MTIKELKNHFKVFGRFSKEHPYLIYSKEEQGKRSNHKYLCSLIKKGSKFCVVGTENYSSKLDEIKKNIENYIKSLPYDSGYYDPTYRKGYFVEMIISDYLNEKGFNVSDKYGDTVIFKYKSKNLYGGTSQMYRISIYNLDTLTFEVKNNELPENVKILFWTGDYSWVESKCKRTPEDIIKTIDGLLKPLFLTESAENLKVSNQFNFEQLNATLNKLDTSSLDTISMDIKNEVKEKLEKLLSTL